MRPLSRFYSRAIVLVILMFHLLFLAHGGQVVSTNDLIVDSSGDSMKVGKGGCGKEGGDCKQENGKGEAEEKLFENEDYIYTQSLP
ncbi:hypothetical protein K7X08_002947 [Anisodus acutangulus]|uniref:Transmembrane protein n=2 Tax=Anisodus TaxID=243963 RepID=A0A9Q1RHG7_9SOLA|nr:hypothetical protein K7X08_002947 [Anisodus acutangulus]KAK4366800.1 hypothetical protein RND71_014680 [Anisodus tanguticus]